MSTNRPFDDDRHIATREPHPSQIADPKVALKIAESLRLAVAETPLTLSRGQHLYPTVSIRVAERIGDNAQAES